LTKYVQGLIRRLDYQKCPIIHFPIGWNCRTIQCPMLSTPHPGCDILSIILPSFACQAGEKRSPCIASGGLGSALVEIPDLGLGTSTHVRVINSLHRRHTLTALLCLALMTQNSPSDMNQRARRLHESVASASTFREGWTGFGSVAAAASAGKPSCSRDGRHECVSMIVQGRRDPGYREFLTLVRPASNSNGLVELLDFD
jgi:hypothetical protein